MYVEFFQAYPGGHTKDPGYASFRVNCNGRLYTGMCDPDGTHVRHLSTAHGADRPYRALKASRQVEMAPRIASVLATHLVAKKLATDPAAVIPRPLKTFKVVYRYQDDPGPFSRVVHAIDRDAALRAFHSCGAHSDLVDSIEEAH